MRTQLAAALSALALIPASLTLTGASSPDSTAENAPPETPITTITTEDGVITEVTDFPDGSSEAIVSTNIGGVPAVVGCGPQVTENDLDRYLEAGPPPSGQPDNGPVGTGSDPCAVGAAAGPGTDRMARYKCLGWKHFDGDDVHSNMCAQFVVKEETGLEMIWATKGKTTAHTDDGRHGDGNCWDCDELNRISTYVKWYDGDEVFDFEPSNTAFPPSGCSTSNVGVSYSGLSASTDVQVCTQSFGPWAVGDHGSGSRWMGSVQQLVWRTARFIHMAATDDNLYPSGWMQYYIRWD